MTSIRRRWVRVFCLSTATLGVVLLGGWLETVAAQAQPTRQVVRPPRPTPKPRPTRIPRPTRPPGPRQTVLPPATATPTFAANPSNPVPTATATATPTAVLGPQSCPGVPVTCPQPPACKTGNKIGQMYYKYPASVPIITNKPGEMRLNRNSNGIDPDRETGSFSLTDKDGIVVAQMPNLVFQRQGSGWIAETPDGWVRIAPKEVGPGYVFQFQYNTPQFPPGYFSVVYQLCLSIGDDGIDEQIVCQPKARDGFLCHNNGPTF